MRLIDAALTVLKAADSPLKVEVINKKAIKLLKKECKVASMKAALTRESKKNSSLKQQDDGWVLGASRISKTKKATKPAKQTTATKKATKSPKQTTSTKKATKSTKPTKSTKDAKSTSGKQTKNTKAAGGRKDAAPKTSKPKKSKAEPTEPALALGEGVQEYTDALTPYEDRELHPPILAPKKRRRGRDREPADRKQQTKPAAESKVESKASRSGKTSLWEQGGRIARAAYATLSEMKGGGNVQVKQLAQMMAKRQLLGGNPLKQWPALKASLLVDEAQSRAKGLPAKIRYEGRDLFKKNQLEQETQALVDSVESLQLETMIWLESQLQEMAAKPLATVVHTYLSSVGFTQISWIKMLDHACYATAVQPGTSWPTMIAVVPYSKRGVSRRGVGELRVGITKKKRLAGMLISPGDLSDDAKVELQKDGASVSLLLARQLCNELARHNIGVNSKQMTVCMRDSQFFHEVLAACERAG